MSAALLDPIASQCITNEHIRHPKQTQYIKRAASGMFATMSIPLAAGAGAISSGEELAGPRPLKRSHKRAYALGVEHLTAARSAVALCGTLCRGVKPERKVSTCGWCTLVARQGLMTNSEKGQMTAKIRGNGNTFW